MQQLADTFKIKNATVYCYVLCFGYYALTAYIIVFDFILFLLCIIGATKRTEKKRDFIRADRFALRHYLPTLYIQALIDQ